MDVVCSKHFSEDDFYFTGKTGRKMLKQTAVPISIHKKKRIDWDSTSSVKLPRRDFKKSTEMENARLRKRLHKQQLALRKTRRRETRLRKTLKTVMEDLKKQKLLTDDLRMQLTEYEGEEKLIEIVVILCHETFSG